MKNYFKILLLFAITSLFLFSCEKDENSSHEHKGSSIVKKVTIDDFNNIVNKNNAYNKIKNHFDINHNKTTHNSHRNSSENSFTILTNEILLIEINEIQHYTFKVLTNTISDEFYNLVVNVNSNHEIIKSELYKYTPDTNWLLNTNQPYTGYVSVDTNHNIDLSNNTSRLGNDCIVGVSSYWNCGANNNHEPGNQNCDLENNIVTQLIIEFEYGPCDSNDTVPYIAGPEDPGAGSGSSSGNTTSNNNDEDTVVTQPILMIRAEQALLNTFTTIDQYNWWADTDQTTKDNIINYLNTNNNYSNQEALDFVIELINEFIENNLTKLNIETFDDQITTNVPPCIDNLINDMKSLNSGKFGKVIQKFIGNNPLPANYNWQIQTTNLPIGVNGSTTGSVQPGGIVVTEINSNYINVATDLSLIKTLIHECFHAYLVSVYRFRDIDKNYVNLLNSYTTQFGNSNDLHHHAFITTNIINEIATAIFEYSNIKGYGLNLQYCTDLAWGGLQGTNAFNALPISDQERIISVLAAEQYNSNNHLSNILNLNPKGNVICP